MSANSGSGGTGRRGSACSTVTSLQRSIGGQVPLIPSCAGAFSVVATGAVIGSWGGMSMIAGKTTNKSVSPHIVMRPMLPAQPMIFD